MRRRSDGEVADAFMFQSLFKPVPSWLHGREDVRLPTVEKPMMVQIITGKWWPVNANDWIIDHKEGLYLIEDCDIGHTHDEV